MSKIHPARAFSSRKFSGFRGFGHTEVLSGVSPSVVRNFRPREDGIMEIRSGFSEAYSFDAPLRGYWEGNVNNVARKYAVAGDTVYLLYDDMTGKLAVGHLPTSSGAVSFVLLQDVLYLLEGSDIYYLKNNAFIQSQPYVPLYGNNWHPTNFGDIKEHINLLTNKLRVRYMNSTGSTIFRLPFFPTTVDRVLLNGSSTQNFAMDGRDVVVTDAANITTVEIGFTMNLEMELRNTILSSPGGFVFGSGNEERLVLYGAEGDYCLHCTTPVTMLMSVGSQNVYYDSGDLYFTHTGTFPVGDTEHQVTSVCRCKGGFLAFTQNRTSFFGYDKEKPVPTLTTVISGTGCTAIKASGLCGETPVSVDDGGVTLFRSDRTHPEIIDTVKISDAVIDRFGSGFCQKAVLFWDGRHEELWIGNPEDPDGIFWIWNRQLETWYSFDSIAASALFSVSLQSGRKVGMLRGKQLCLFDDDLHTDNGKDITAVYRTSFFDCSHAETPRRAIRASLCAAPDGNSIFLSLETERSRKSFSFSANTGEIPAHYDCRFASGRHRFLRCTLTSSGSGNAKFYALSVYEKL